MDINRGLIVSVQGYDSLTTETLAREAVNAGAVAIRTDKPINVDVPIIGLQKINSVDKMCDPFITPNPGDIARVSQWADYVAVDCRKINKKLKEINDFCITENIRIIADIFDIHDYLNVKDNGYKYEHIATTLSVFNRRNHRHYPDIKLVKDLYQYGERNIIAEGNYHTRKQVESAILEGAQNICIGNAITNIYKLTKKYTGLF